MIGILFGPPGSGKGTQAQMAARRFALPHVSTGTILREEVERKSELGRQVAPLLDKGELVPDSLILEIVGKHLEEERSRGALLDGFPRTVAQASGLLSMLKEHGLTIFAVVALDVPEGVLEGRILKRGEIEHRSDDNEESFLRRMAEYREKTAPVLSYLETQGITVHHIDGDGSIESVADKLSSLFCSVGLAPVA